MAVKHTWVVNAEFPALIAHKAYRSVRVLAGNWKQATRKAVRALGKLDDLRGRRVKVLSLRIVRADYGAKYEK